MRFILKTMICFSCALAVGAGTVSRSQDKDNDPLTPKRLDLPGLEKTLKNMGYEIQHYYKNVPNVAVARDGTTYFVNFYISTNYVILECRLFDSGPGEKYSPAGLRRLLEENKRIAPAVFSHDGDGFVLNLPVQNADISPATLRREISALADAAKRTLPLWNRGRELVMYSPPSPTPEAQADLDALQGTWIPVEGEQGGIKLSAEQFQATGKFTVKGKKTILLTKDVEKEMEIYLETTKNPRQLDMLNPKTKDVERAIYQIKEGNLWLCFDRGNTNNRPKEFATRPKTNETLVKLKKMSE